MKMSKQDILEELMLQRNASQLTYPTEKSLKNHQEFVDELIRIVKASNDGWILCSEKMPEERESYFEEYKGTPRWNNSMFEAISDIVNVTVVQEDGQSIVIPAHTTDGKWRHDYTFLEGTEIIAWRPLPTPFNKLNENA